MFLNTVGFIYSGLTLALGQCASTVPVLSRYERTDPVPVRRRYPHSICQSGIGPMLDPVYDVIRRGRSKLAYGSSNCL